MELVCRCTSCEVQFKVDEKYAGRKAKCPKCATVVLVPAGQDAEAAAARVAASAETVMIRPAAVPRKKEHENASEETISIRVDSERTVAPAKSGGPSKVEINVGTTGSSEENVPGPTFLVATGPPSKPPGGTAAAEPEKRPTKGKKLPAILPIIGGGVLAVIIVGTVFGVYSLVTGRGKSSAGKPPSVKPKSKENTGAALAPKKASGNSVANPTPGSSFNPPGAAGVAGYAGWLQNLEVAQRRAGQGKKDLLLVFVSSDSSEPCQALLRDVLTGPAFRDLADAKFIPVVIDLPRDPAAYNMLEDSAQNSRLLQQYNFTAESLPALVLLDTQGRPYALHQAYDGQGTQYLEKLRKSLDDRAERDRILALPAAAQGAQRLMAAKEAVAWLQNHNLLGLFPSEVKAWLQFAKQYDPNNEQGSHEVIFEADWLCRLNELRGADLADRMRKHMAELESWQQAHKFRDANRGGRLHLLAAMTLAQLNDLTGAARQLELGLACNPTDPRILESLQGDTAAVAQAGQVGSGTGFIVSAQGYILTNHHVIVGPGQVVVRLSDLKKDTINATVVATDEQRDMALLKVAPPAGIVLAPVVISSADVRRGARVAAFGFPLGDQIGQSLKQTQGAVSALADPATNNGLMLLDMRINPGNSGGPVCDTRGQVVGLITAKTVRAEETVDTYGMARPTPELHAFLKKNMPGYAPPAVDEKREGLDWEEVDKIISPSVVMVIKLDR